MYVGGKINLSISQLIYPESIEKNIEVRNMLMQS